jgi:hypothetical protein
MKWDDEIIVIAGHVSACHDITFDTYRIYLGGYEYMLETGEGIPVGEHNIEHALNHEVIHCVMNDLGEQADALDYLWAREDGIWAMYDVSFLEGLADIGVGFE